MKGVYDTASILAYNQRTNLQQFYVTYLSLRILIRITYLYFENTFYTMHNNLLRRCAYHQNILRKRKRR